MLFAPWLVLRVAARAPFVVLRAAPLAQDFALRVAALSQTWLARVAARAASARRCLAEQLFVFLSMCYLISLAVSGASVLCFTGATMLRQCSREGASCGWRCSRKGVPTGSARTPMGHITRCARARGMALFSGTYMRMVSGVRAAWFSDLLGEHPQKLDVACSGRCGPLFSHERTHVTGKR